MDTYFPNVEDIVSLARNGTHVPTWGTHPFLNNYEFLQVEILMKLHLLEPSILIFPMHVSIVINIRID
jgi:hypothetical protein